MHRLSQCAANWRRRSDHTIIPQHGQLQALLALNGPPWNRYTLRIPDPRLAVCHCGGEELNRVESRGHWAVDAQDGFLTGQAGFCQEVGETAEGGAQGEDSSAGGGDSEGATCHLVWRYPRSYYIIRLSFMHVLYCAIFKQGASGGGGNAYTNIRPNAERTTAKRNQS